MDAAIEAAWVRGQSSGLSGACCGLTGLVKEFVWCLQVPGAWHWAMQTSVQADAMASLLRSIFSL